MARKKDEQHVGYDIPSVGDKLIVQLRSGRTVNGTVTMTTSAYVVVVSRMAG